MSASAVVLLSAGLDSTTNLYAARDAGFDVRLTLTFDYGQRAAAKEIQRSREIASRVGVPHRVVELGFFSGLGGSALTDETKEIPAGAGVSIDDFDRSRETAKSVWVPNRNGIFLNVAAGFAEAMGAAAVIPGFNAEEGATFPDNTPEFMSALTKSFSFSTSNGVQVECFTQSLEKPDIARRAKVLDVPFEMLWPCYFGGDKPCGRCESCQRDRRALEVAGVDIDDLFEEIRQ